jgi:hypothetical protein
MTKRRIQVIALAVLGVIGLSAPAHAAKKKNKRQKEQPLEQIEPLVRRIGGDVTVDRMQNALTAAASIANVVTGGPTVRRARAAAPSEQRTARIRAHRRRMNEFVTERVDGLKKLQTYRRLRGD